MAAKKYNVQSTLDESSLTNVHDDYEDVKSSGGCCCSILFNNNMPPLKILLIGTGGCGKSTIMKQITNHTKNKLRDDDSINEKDANEYKQAIVKNILTNAFNLVKGMKQIELDFDDKKNEQFSQEINNVLLSTNWYERWFEIKREYGVKFKSIWCDKGIQQAYTRRNEFFLDDSTEYFMSHLDRILNDTYTPSFADILRVRQPTTEIKNYTIKIEDQPILFIDIGGQINERSKWTSVFDGVTSLMFVISLNDFDLYLSDDELRDAGYASNEKKNRLRESFNIFNWVVNRLKPSDKNKNELLFKNTGLMLFFNKIDLFDAKMMNNTSSQRLKELCFNDFNTMDTQYHDVEAKQFIKKKFTSIIKGNREVHSHFTCAVDAKSMDIVIKNVKAVITRLIMRAH